MALVVAATLAEIAAPGSPFAGRTAVVAAFAMLALAGLIQVLLGAFRIGGLIRYVPYPVITGIVTGSGILIVLDQMRARLLAGLAVDPMHRAQISRFQHHPNHTGHDTAHGDAAESGNDIAGDGHERPLKRKLKPFLSTRTNLLCWKNISQNKPRSVSCLRR
ncbi:MAG: SulP family inorganic anion transporter [Acidimicrobiia bacterium]|nr:SulP family inorganic anion transporter [Acidimicrobiia bacterium]